MLACAALVLALAGATPASDLLTLTMSANAGFRFAAGARLHASSDAQLTVPREHSLIIISLIDRLLGNQPAESWLRQYQAEGSENTLSRLLLRSPTKLQKLQSAVGSGAVLTFQTLESEQDPHVFASHMIAWARHLDGPARIEILQAWSSQPGQLGEQARDQLALLDGSAGIFPGFINKIAEGPSDSDWVALALTLYSGGVGGRLAMKGLQSLGVVTEVGATSAVMTISERGLDWMEGKRPAAPLGTQWLSNTLVATGSRLFFGSLGNAKLLDDPAWHAWLWSESFVLSRHGQPEASMPSLLLGAFAVHLPLMAVGKLVNRFVGAKAPVPAPRSGDIQYHGKTPFTYGVLEPGCNGLADAYGCIQISLALKNQPQALLKTLNHERFHSWLSPRGNPSSKFGKRIQGKRAGLGIAYYNDVEFMRLVEEFGAEIYATRSFVEGMALALHPGYKIYLPKAALQGASYVFLLGESVWLGRKFIQWQLAEAPEPVASTSLPTPRRRDLDRTTQ